MLVRAVLLILGYYILMLIITLIPPDMTGNQVRQRDVSIDADRAGVTGSCWALNFQSSIPPAFGAMRAALGFMRAMRWFCAQSKVSGDEGREGRGWYTRGQETVAKGSWAAEEAVSVVVCV